MVRVATVFSRWCENRQGVIRLFVIGTIFTDLSIKLLDPVLSHFMLFHYIYYWQIVLAVCGIWSVAIFIHDLIKKKLMITVPQILLWVFDAWVFISMAVNQMFNTDAGTVVLLVIRILNLFMFTTVFFSAPLYYSRHENREFLIRLSKDIVVIITVINLISFLIFLTGRQDVAVMLNGGYQIPFYADIGHGTTGTVLRFEGLFGHPNYAGFRGYLCICLCLYLNEHHRIKKPFLMISMLLSVFMICVPNCRSAIIALALIVICLLFRYISSIERVKDNPKLHKVLWGIVAAIIIAAAVLYSGKAAWILKDPYDRLNVISSGRVSIWKLAFESTFQEKPWFGFGYINMENPVYIQYKWEYSHNLFASITLWSGFPALIVFLLFLVFSLRSYQHGKGESTEKSHVFWLQLLILCILIQAMFDQAVIGNTYPETGIFWAVCGYLLSLVNNNQKSKFQKQ